LNIILLSQKVEFSFNADRPLRHELRYDAFASPSRSAAFRRSPVRLKKPIRAMIDQVRITREGNDAIIDYADPGISGTRLTIGPQIVTMTGCDIVDVFNGILIAQERLLADWNKTVVEEPLGEKQIDYHEEGAHWVPRGDVLRCAIDDAGPDGEVTIHIDDKELSLVEFGRLLRVHAGWGMRIAFVPEEYVTENPKVEIRKSKRRNR
jgi:hypothetical protein